MNRVVVLGLMGQYPLGGMAWQVLHHLIGFRRLGCESFYVENSGAPPYSPGRQSIVESATDNIKFLRNTFRHFNLSEAWAYYDCLTNRWFGMRKSAVQELLEHADLIVNLCGATLPDPDQRRKGCLVYIDTDPGLQQVQIAQGNRASRAYIESHDVHFTYGWNVGETSSLIPSGGIVWLKTHPPVLADLWDAPPGRRNDFWRTITTYHNKGKDVVIDGETYLWSKHPNFEQVVDLPSRTGERLEAAMTNIDEPIRDRFLSYGWRLIDPYTVNKSAGSYRQYVLGAKGEFSVEKDSYVRLNSGWFSDRTVCFLATGRPCVVQDTGFGARVPCGLGLLAWRTAEEATDALDRVAREYREHARAARAIALEFFEARILLKPILDAVGL